MGRGRDGKSERAAAAAALLHGELETRGRVGGRASQTGKKEGREVGVGLVSRRSQSEAGVVLCRVNLTLATQ